MRKWYALKYAQRSDSDASPLTGGCLCGAIRYTVSVPITELRMCHCRDCQKSTGTAGSVNAMIKSDTI